MSVSLSHENDQDVVGAALPVGDQGDEMQATLLAHCHRCDGIILMEEAGPLETKLANDRNLWLISAFNQIRTHRCQAAGTVKYGPYAPRLLARAPPPVSLGPDLSELHALGVAQLQKTFSLGILLGTASALVVAAVCISMLN